MNGISPSQEYTRKFDCLLGMVSCSRRLVYLWIMIVKSSVGLCLRRAEGTRLLVFTPCDSSYCFDLQLPSLSTDFARIAVLQLCTADAVSIGTVCEGCTRDFCVSAGTALGVDVLATLILLEALLGLLLI